MYVVLKVNLKKLYNEISICKYDLIFLTETWLNHCILDSEICDLNIYLVFRQDRVSNIKTQCGGVLILVSHKLSVKTLSLNVSPGESLLCHISYDEKYES